MERIRIAASFAVIFLAGCAHDAATSPDSFDTAKYEPACAQQCLNSHKRCITSGQFYNAIEPNTAVVDCRAAAHQCLSRCPAK